jgi:hypothetical protein
MFMYTRFADDACIAFQNARPLDVTRIVGRIPRRDGNEVEMLVAHVERRRIRRPSRRRAMNVLDQTQGVR